MSKSILDKLDEMTSNADCLDSDEEQGLKPMNAFPFFFAVSLVFCLILTSCIISLVMNFSYDVNSFLDSYMLIISAVMGALMLIMLVSGFIGLSKGFSIAKLLTVIITLAGIVLSIAPFLIPGLLYL